MVKKLFPALFLVFIILSCQQPEKHITVLSFEKDLIPEGIAIDHKNRTLFINSLKKNKIVSASLIGENPKDLIKTDQHGYLSGFGMTTKGDTLFALGNSLPKNNNQSVLLLLNTSTGALITSYSLQDSTLVYLNDLAVSSKNDIYITDSESNKIYTIQKSKGVLEVFLDSQEIAHPNGIAISEDDKYLYVASYRHGIRIIDIASGKIINKANAGSRGIDGMKYYNNSLLSIVNGYRDTTKVGVFRFHLNENSTEIIRKEKLVGYGEYFELPTTFAIHDNHMYYVINSQLENFNQESNNIIESEKLKSYKLMKLKID